MFFEWTCRSYFFHKTETVRQELRNRLDIVMPHPENMINVPFTHNLESRRQKAGLTQQQAAQMSLMTRQRWGAIERGTGRPTAEEFRRMEALLGMLQGPVKPSRVFQALLNRGRREAPTPLPYFPPQDRPSFQRFHAAGQRCPRLVARLACKIAARTDFAICEFLCDRIAFNSYAEVLFALHLLANGAVPSLVAPAWLGAPTPCEIVEPELQNAVGHRPTPCLIHGENFYFFQVSFETPRVYTVDALAWSRASGWSVLEVDGGGHDSCYDPEQETAIGLPTRRISALQLEQFEFLAA